MFPLFYFLLLTVARASESDRNSRDFDYTELDYYVYPAYYVENAIVAAPLDFAAQRVRTVPPDLAAQRAPAVSLDPLAASLSHKVSLDLAAQRAPAVFFDATKVVISWSFLLIMRWSGHPGDLALAQNSVAAFYFRAPFCEYLAKFLWAVSPQSSSVTPSSTSPDVTIFAPVYESRRVMELIRLSIYDRWEECVLGLHSWTSILELVLNSAEVALLAAARADFEWPGPPGSYGAFRDQDLDDWRLRPPDYYVYPAYYVENAIVDFGTLEEVDHGTLEEADY
jgi:hypothetical protein